MKYKVSNIVEKNWQDKKFVEFSAVDTEGVGYDKVSDWTSTVTVETSEVEGLIEKNNKGYWQFKAPVSAGGSKKPNMDRIMEKKSDMIGQAQDRKEQSIARAQDRSAWMWAKTNASTLLTLMPEALKGKNSDAIADMVVTLATKIYNGEPLVPFSAPVKLTEPQYEYPEEDISPDSIPF